MLEYNFLTQIDQFKFTSGKYPILILGTHAYCNKSKIEKELHYCDFAISPILNDLIKKYSHEFYILENQVPRKEIDMNRFESRLYDIDDNNDYLYRQMIRFLLFHISKKYTQLPLLFDLHSFGEHDE